MMNIYYITVKMNGDIVDDSGDDDEDTTINKTSITMLIVRNIDMDSKG